MLLLFIIVIILFHAQHFGVLNLYTLCFVYETMPAYDYRVRF